MSIMRGDKVSTKVKQPAFSRDMSDMAVSPAVKPDPKYVGIADKADYGSAQASTPK
jgi:hypothetical protein